MNSSLSVRSLSFSGTSLAVVMRSGEPFWFARQLADVLEYGRGDAIHKLISDAPDVFVDGEDIITVVGDELRELKGLDVATTSSGGHKIPSNAPSVTLLSESGVFMVLLKSNQPKALSFARWLTREVLPQIRKTGSYGSSSAHEDHERRLSRLERFVSGKSYLQPSSESYDDIYSEIERVVRAMVSNGDYGVWVRGDFVLVNTTCLHEAWSKYSSTSRPSVNMAGRVLARNRKHRVRETVNLENRRVNTYRLCLH